MGLASVLLLLLRFIVEIDLGGKILLVLIIMVIVAVVGTVEEIGVSELFGSCGAGGDSGMGLVVAVNINIIISIIIIYIIIEAFEGGLGQGVIIGLFRFVIIITILLLFFKLFVFLDLGFYEGVIGVLFFLV